MSIDPMFLNLDDLTTESKSVKLDGVTHTAAEMTTELYITRLKEAKLIKALDDQGDEFANKVEQSVSFLSDMFPTITKDVLVKLPLRKLSKLITFAMTAPEDIAKGVEAAQNQSEAPVGNV